MQHELFGNIEHLHSDEGWRGDARLPEFADFGKFCIADDDRRPRKPTVRLRINDPEERGPSPEQQAAYRFLMENEPAVRRAVVAGLFKSYTDYHTGLIPDGIAKSLGAPPATGPEGLREHCRFVELEISRQHHRGMSYLAFHVDCTWEPEHGMIIVYHRDKPTEWTTADSLVDLFESDADDADEEPRAPSQKLFDALAYGDEEGLRRLLDAGADINDIGTDRPNPPLCQAAPSGNIVWVRRLLALKADPNLKDYRGRTALDCVRRLLIQLEPKKPRNWLERLLRWLGPLQVDAGMRDRLREIVQLLEAAGAKGSGEK
jgi:hypothetical protein